MKYKEKWRNYKIKTRVLLLYLSLNMISILLILVISLSIVSSTQKNDINTNAQNQLKLITTQIDGILSNITYNIKAFSTSPALQDAITTEYSEDNYGTYLFSSALRSSVHNIMDINQLISNGYIYTDDRQLYDVKSDKVSVPAASQATAYQDVLAQGGRILIGPPVDSSGNSALNVSKLLLHTTTGKKLGMLSFDIKESIIYDAYGSLNFENSGEIFVVNNEDIIISAHNRDLLQQDIKHYVSDFPDKSFHSSAPVFFRRDNGVYLITKSQQGEFKIVYRLNYYTLYKKAFFLTGALLLTGVAIIICIVLLSRKFAKDLTSPLTELGLYAKEVGKGNFNISLKNNYNDEIGSLARQFKRMSFDIKQLTSRIYTEQNMKREYELKLMQAQINPHFLYNCLDSINSLIVDERNDSAVSMVSHLGAYYRFILSKGRNMITLGEELELIKNYLEIQLIKNPSLFTYVISIQKELLEEPILKMLLQPIVENSILHGFTGYLPNRMIKITGEASGSKIIIKIADDGRGMTEDVQKNLFAPSPLAIPKSFGLNSINSRLHLKYGKNYNLTIHSVLNKGTVITIQYPKH